jgi:ABC-2 type transport system ATP-binding protein
MAGDVVLECRELTKRFGERVAVDGVGFTIAAGERYGLLGPNGAGKTTTISMICGLLPRNGGSVSVNGVAIDDRSSDGKAGIGYAPQEIALYPDLTGRENLKFFARLYDLRGRQRDERVNACLDLVGLLERGDDRVDQYSGGMQRRLNIAAGLLHQPSLLVLDEPTVGVDPQSRAAILDKVESLGTEGLAVLYTTHYMEEAQRLCDRIGIMDEGRLIAEGTPRELIDLVGGQDRVRLTASGELATLAGALARVEGVTQASVAGGSPADESGDAGGAGDANGHGEPGAESAVELVVRGAGALLPALLAAAADAGVAVTGVEVVEPDLEAVFLHLTGKALRD